MKSPFQQTRKLRHGVWICNWWKIQFSYPDRLTLWPFLSDTAVYCHGVQVPAATRGLLLVMTQGLIFFKSEEKDHCCCTAQLPCRFMSMTSTVLPMTHFSLICRLTFLSVNVIVLYDVTYFTSWYKYTVVFFQLA